MEQLQLKEIVGYLPYGLKCISQVENLGVETIKGFEIYSSGIELITNIDNLHILECKPILFPISSLTEFREDLGFVPIEYIEELYYATNLGSQIERIIEDERWINHTDFMIIQYFYEWKIDIHNLIEKELAIAVTKEFNSYK
jgi:hypothetical protein